MKKFVALLFAASIVVQGFAQSVPIPGGGRAVRAPSNSPSDGQAVTYDAASGGNKYSTVGGGGGSAPTGTMVNTAATAAGQVFVAADTTKTNATPVSTLTGIFVQKRIHQQTNVSTLTPNWDLYDVEELTAQTSNLTIANPTGTPKNEQDIRIVITCASGTPTLSLGTAYGDSRDLAKPTTLTGGTFQDRLLITWNATKGTNLVTAKNFGF